MRRAAIVLPFALVPLVSRCAVAPIGDRIAKRVVEVAPAPPRSTEPPVVIVPTPVIAEAGADDPDELAGRLPPPVPPDHHEPRRRAEVAHDAGVGDAGATPEASTPAVRGIFVPAAAAARALERRVVGAANAVTRDGTPVGARLVGVSKYGTGLQDGDIVISVNGVRTPTVNAMVSAAMSAVSAGATRISGRVIRGDTTLAVVLEIPPR